MAATGARLAATVALAAAVAGAAGLLLAVGRQTPAPAPAPAPTAQAGTARRSPHHPRRHRRHRVDAVVARRLVVRLPFEARDGPPLLLPILLYHRIDALRPTL